MGARRTRASPSPGSGGSLSARMLSVSAAAARLAVTERTLRGWIAAEKFPVVRLSRRCLRILPEDLARFIEERRRGR